MSFGNPVIFPFPAVQYIPLSIINLMEGTIIDGSKHALVEILAGPDLVSWRTILKNNYGINLPTAFPPNTIPILAVNLLITDIKYRGFFVTMIGSQNQGHYQLFTIPSDRFYKSKLFFTVFNSATKKLAQYSLFLPPQLPLKCEFN